MDTAEQKEFAKKLMAKPEISKQLFEKVKGTAFYTEMMSKMGSSEDLMAIAGQMFQNSGTSTQQEKAGCNEAGH